MRKLLTDSIIGNTQMPLKSGSLVHIQLAYQEAIGELGKAFSGQSYSAGTVYTLNGLFNSGSGNNYNISAGSVLYNGEVFLVDSASFTAVSPQTAVATIVETFFTDPTADLVEFSDGVLRAVHVIRKVKISSGLVGDAGVISAYSTFVDRDKVLKGAIGQIVMWNWRIYGGAYSDYFDGSGLGIHPYTAGWAVPNGNNNTDDLGGFFPVGYKASDSDYSTPFVSNGGAKTVILLTVNFPSGLSLTYKRSLFLTADNNAGTANQYLHEQAPAPLTGTRVGISALNGGQSDSGNQLAYFEDTATIGGSGVAFDKRPPFKAVLYVQRIQ